MSALSAVRSAAALMLLLSACAPTMTWNKEGATQQDYNKDHYTCEKDARQSGYYGSGIVGAININNFFKECMVAHGWTLIPEGPTQPVVDIGGVPRGPESGVPSEGSDTRALPPR